MPSPLGHALGGLAAGWLVQGPPPRRDPGRGAATDAAPPPGWLRILTSADARRRAMLFAGLGMLPDIDFLFGAHSMYTHSMGAVLLVGLLAFWLFRLTPAGALAVAAAYGSHVLLDWLGTDARAPVGIMALWPLSAAFVQSDLHIFMAIRRETWLANFWSHNLLAVFREALILVPIAVLVVCLRGVRRAARTDAEPFDGPAGASPAPVPAVAPRTAARRDAAES